MNYFGFWSKFYQLLDPDPHSECGSGSRRQILSGSETLGTGNDSLLQASKFNITSNCIVFKRVSPFPVSHILFAVNLLNFIKFKKFCV
jgi:hypothetical protein